MVLFPLYVIGLIVFYRNKNQKGIILTGLSLAAIIIQCIFCYFSMMQNNAHESANASFSLNLLSMGEQIIVAFSYYFKAYIHLLAPFLETTGQSVIIVIALMMAIVLALLIFAIQMIRKSPNRKIAIWFIAGNFVALSSIVFYAHTFPKDVIIDRSNTLNLIRSVDVNLMRYTIGIHTILAVTVIPFVVFVLCGFFKMEL
jgi:hypothetical protein